MSLFSHSAIYRVERTSSRAGVAPAEFQRLSRRTPAGTIVEYYIDANGVDHGFVRGAKGNFAILDAPGAGTSAGQGTQALDLTQARIVGYYFDASGVTHGYTRGPDSKFANFDAPDAGTGPGQGTAALAINAAGTISGLYVDANGVGHGFVRSADGTITSFGPTGSVFTSGDRLGINSAATVSGAYFDVNGAIHGFVRARDGTIASIDVPGAGQGTGASMINVVEVIPGAYTDSSGVNHGFLQRICADAVRRIAANSSRPIPGGFSLHAPRWLRANFCYQPLSDSCDESGSNLRRIRCWRLSTGVGPIQNAISRFGWITQPLPPTG